ncbi:hypothetical protein LNAOJCKE_4670 [Methylorubrum aminovorans]|uniref:Uncharacterized protein n=1 Tax=Methylorubrum aminovorans TaxID=269069 RepID=A0ABQ4UJE2_9HYPH|nr:hypothetical protein LNAOJCKE_4670 [Methylorubrum aminovorans]GMA74783.1 hypothetical protein GCM10025880_12000 [Methylorubrum aminovorans]
MPRWNRCEKPDHRHLWDVTDEAALVNAIRSSTYGEGDDYRLLSGFQSYLRSYRLAIHKPAFGCAIRGPECPLPQGQIVRFCGYFSSASVGLKRPMAWV